MPSALSSNEILKELNISRSTFYYLLKHHLIELPTTSTGRYVWDEKSISQLKTMLKEAPADNTAASEPAYKTTQINNRRYLGNKYKLLDFIKSTVNRECSAINTFADIFAGTGSVASAFSDKKLITNDLLYFNYICHKKR